MFNKKILFAALLSAAFALSAGAAGFAKTETYTPGQFTDVPESEWYAAEVQSTYELGLMNGVGGSLFAPEGDVTVAEAITMAARAASIGAGETIAAADGEWYAPYVNYALAKGFVAEGQFDNYDRPAKRREVAVLFEGAMPDGYFAAQNDVSSIPDVSDKQAYHDELLTLYKAGVVMGSDSYGNFRPEDNITRAEAAAVITRVALPEKRLAKTLDKISDDDAYALILTSSFNASKEGINSGWVLDNRGGLPRTSLTANYGALFDIDDTAGTALIREFNKITTGSIDLYTKATISGYDGIFLEYQNDTGDSVYRLQTVDGDWKLRGADGSYTTVYEIGENERLFTFRINVDLDNNRSTTYINDTLCGTYPLATVGDKTNLLNFRYGTTEESTSIVAPSGVTATANYTVNEDFSTVDGKTLPFDWTGDAAVSGGELKVSDGTSASTAFSPVSGKVAAEFMVLLPKKGESVTYSAGSGTKDVVVFTGDENAFYVNGTKVYDYVQNLWYRLRFEIDTDTATVLVKLNGRQVGEVPFAEAATSIDNIRVSGTSATPASFDNFKVFRLIEHEDYVPVPVKPVGEDKYVVGMNVCSLWQNGYHFGWSCITPYDDPQPVLGYYDEGVAETADWEIKYLVEHGIDFQAFCVYFGSQSGVQRLSATHLYDGFMNAKYSDMTNFCIIWEAANASSPNSMEAWKNDYVPYFIENFFKDPRHITIDNRLVLCVFGTGNLSSRLGGDDKVKEAFDYLEEEVQKLGFDGMIYLACGSASDRLGAMGFDGAYAYNWGNNGYQLDVNKTSILSSAKNTAVYTVPTVSVGFNSIPWHGIRYPMMTMEDYAAAHEWVKSEYLPTYAKEKWQESFVMLSTWNEYGEGTYIMPSNDEKGFGYIDVIREAYTDEKIDASLNDIPTEAQRYRINHLYPQYRRLLRKEGWYVEEINEAELEAAYTVDYSKITATGSNCWSIRDFKVDADGLHGTSSGSDPIVILQNKDLPEGITLEDITAVRITAKIPKGSVMEMFYITDKDESWNQTKAKTFAASTTNDYAEYLVSAAQLKSFTGTLKGLRIDPATGPDISFSIKSVEFLKPKSSSKLSKNIHINGNTYTMNFAPEFSESGEVLVAFDPAVALDFTLNTFHVWDKASQTLTLYFTDHTLVYTVGSDKYLLDGKEKRLGFTMTSIDGLPLVPIKLLCSEVGYTYSTNADSEIVIETKQKAYFDQVNAERVYAQWEFNTVGDTENWGSGFMSLLVNDGYMSCESMSASTDPTITYRTEISLPAEKYSRIEYRVRYKYDSEKKQELTMYFGTDKESGHSESKTVKIPLGSNDSGGEWEVYTKDLSEVSSWKDTITSLRFDPFNATGHIDIDYIRFIENPDYKEVDPADKPFVLQNGDAEDGAGTFGSRAKIVADPDNSANKCYVLDSVADKQEWIYAYQGVTYKPGCTYKVSCRIRLASHGGDTELADDFKATILSNAQYLDADGKVDHVVARKTISAGDGWQTFEFEYTVPADSTDRSKDQFSMYSDPVNSVGVGYYFDDVVVTEVKPEA